MSLNFLELAQEYLGGDAARQASAALGGGESESGISSALRGLVPVVLGGVAARAQQPGGAAEVLDLAQQAHGSGILNNLSGLLGGTGGLGNSPDAASGGGLLSRGTDLLHSALGPQLEPAVAGIGQQAGVSSSTMSSLLGMATPMVLGLLGRHAADNHLDAGGLSTMLSGLGGNMGGTMGSSTGSLTDGLGTMAASLGLGGAAASLSQATTSVATTTRETASAAGATASAAAGRVGEAVRGPARDVVHEVEDPGPKGWPWLVLALLSIGVIFYFMRDRIASSPNTTAAAPVAVADTAPATTPAATTATGRYDAATGNYVYDTGASAALTLPDGTVLNVGGNSTEARLVRFLSDKSQTVSTDKTQGWISLDRVYFDTGKATLTAASLEQLQHMGAILKAFPEASFKLGGYTDNQGQPKNNLLLSTDRANAARMAAVAGGTAPGRVTAEGYGQEHPLASNDTPEGRAQNRRVDVRVTKK